MRRAIRGGGFYFAVVFAAGFGLGVARTLLLEPHFGPTASVLAELPVILAVSWAASAFVADRAQVGRSAAARIVMGATAFIMLICAEFVLGISLGAPPDATLAAMRTTPGLIGLGGQATFALIPLLQTARRLRRD